MTSRMLQIALILGMCALAAPAAATTFDEALMAAGDGKYIQAGNGTSTGWGLTVEFAAPLTYPQYVWIHFLTWAPSTNFQYQFYNGDTAVGTIKAQESMSGLLRCQLPGAVDRLVIWQKQGAAAGIVYVDAVTDGDYNAPGGTCAYYYSSLLAVAFPNNTVPVAGDDMAQTEASVAVTIPVLQNDLDADGDPLSVAIAVAPTNGSAVVNANNTVTYTPTGAFVGADEFWYMIDDGNGGTAMAKVTVAVDPMNVLIDIKPGSYPNSINLGSNGVVPVAILSEFDFDATTVDPATVSLAGAGVAVRGKGSRYMAGNQDVNADGLIDLVLQVETENLVPEQLQDGYGTIVGTTYAGVPIIGWDEITIVPVP